MEDFYPPEVAVWWRRGANEGPADEGPTCDHQTHRCSMVVGLEVAGAEWAEGASYGCLVAHISSSEVTEKTIDARAGRVGSLWVGVAN